MGDVILYSRAGCHLCEEALAVARAAGVEPRPVDINGDVRLLRDYATRIPVLRRADTGAELGWPFDAAAVARLLSG